MNLLGLQADQLYTWSDNYAPHIAQTGFVCFAKAKAAAVTPVAATRSSAARFTHRALQAVWQAGMQMRPRSRSWPQVLPLCITNVENLFRLQRFFMMSRQRERLVVLLQA